MSRFIGSTDDFEVVTDHKDYDDDQPRDEDGRFASGGGGGASKAKLLESAGSRFAINSIPAAVAQDNWNGVRQRMEKSLSEAGMTRGDHKANDMFVATLPGGVLGAMNTEGTIAISPQTRDRAHEFYKEWDKDPEGVKDKLANLDVNDPEHVALVDKARGVHTIVHENIHAHGPLTADDWEGDGLAAEELTTEMASRVYMRDNFGHDITKAYEKSLTDRHNGSKAPPIEPPSYHPLVNNTLSAIQEHLPVDRDKAHDI